MTDEQIRRRIMLERRRKRKRRRLIIMCVILVLAVVDGWFVGQAIGKRSVAGETVSILKKPEKLSSNTVTVAEDIPIVNAAVSQIGNKGGEPYWSWYGFASRVAWCGCFVSWVENECGLLDSGAAPKFALVSDGSDWFIDRGQWIKAGKKPSPGDLIFFDWEQDGGRDHVGIVTAVEGNVIFTVEGNSSDRCRMKRYYLDDPVIYGYGHIVE